MSASDSEQSSVPQEHTKTRVEKAQKAKSKAVHSSKLSAKQRLRQGNNSEHFYVDGDTLFCKTCAVSIDYSRQSCLEQHLKTQLHEKTTIFPFPDEFFQNAPSALLSQFVRKVSKSAEAALNKLSKYFDSETGIHPAIRFLQDVRFFNPVTSLEFEEKPDLTIPGFNDIPAGELLLYREKARKFSFGKINDSSTKVKQLEEKIMCLRDFWLANEEVLPTLSALVLCYGFLFSTSADVERTFSKYNSLLADDRKSLSDESLKKILFLFYNLN